MPVSITTSGIVASENTVVAATILTDSSTSLLNFVANIVVVAAVGLMWRLRKHGNYGCDTAQ